MFSPSDIHVFPIDPTLTFPTALVIAGNSLYVANPGFVSRIDLTTGTGSMLIQDELVANPQALAIAGNYLYVANFGNPGFVSRIDLTTGTGSNDWIEDPDLVTDPTALAIAGNYLYVANASGDGGFVSRIDLATGTGSKWIKNELVTTPSALAIAGNYLYVANFGNPGFVSRIDLATGTGSNNWIQDQTLVTHPTALVIAGNSLYVANGNSLVYNNLYVANFGFVSRINLATGTGSKWIENEVDIFPASLVIAGNFLYVSNYKFGPEMQYRPEFLNILKMSLLPPLSFDL